jgi:hypothetical protein
MPEHLDPLLAALRQALAEAGPSLGLRRPEPPLERLPDKGLAHDHVRLVGCGLLARVPKQSQMGLEAEDNLRYQSACFERAAVSGHAPQLRGRLAPTGAGTPLARGGLLVEEIHGRPAALPGDLPVLVDALAAIHRLPVPPAGARPPLLDAADALADLDREIGAQAKYLDAASLDTPVRRQIEAVRERWRRLVVHPARPPRALITFDAHPGNFLITPDGRAVIVDLEKARYSHPPLDLAHATLFTSTTWDLQSRAELGVGEVIAACERWLTVMDAPAGGPDRPPFDATAWAPWLVPLREAMWLWAVTWCAKWRVSSGAPAQRTTGGEDWSASKSNDTLVEHVRGRVDEYLSARGVDFVVNECDALRARFGGIDP